MWAYAYTHAAWFISKLCLQHIVQRDAKIFVWLFNSLWLSHRSAILTYPCVCVCMCVYLLVNTATETFAHFAYTMLTVDAIETCSGAAAAQHHPNNKIPFGFHLLIYLQSQTYICICTYAQLEWRSKNNNLVRNSNEPQSLLRFEALRSHALWQLHNSFTPERFYIVWCLLLLLLFSIFVVVVDVLYTYFVCVIFLMEK